MQDFTEFIKINNIPMVEVDANRNYWLVRTQGGEYHEQFYFDNFIAIGWDEFSDAEKFESIDKETLVKEIEKTYPESKQPGLIYNQIKRFLFEMKVGDVVMIPTYNSTHISFGIITSNFYIEEVSETNIEEGECPFKKRRNVTWLKTVKRTELDPYLYRMMHSHHTINNAKEYEHYIDRTLHSFYIKNGKAHLVLRVRKKNNIALGDFARLLTNIEEQIDLFNEYTNSKLNKKEIELKSNIQSPGIVEFIGGGFIIAILGLILHYIMGGEYKFKISIKQMEISGKTDGFLEKIIRFKELKQKDKKLQEKTEKMKKSLERLNTKLPRELEEWNKEGDI